MKKRMVFFIFLFFSINLLSLSEENLLKNPGFEEVSRLNQPLFWSPRSVVKEFHISSSDIKFKGNYSAKIYFTEKNSGYYASDYIEIIPNKKYLGSVWVKIKNIEGDGVRIRIMFFDSNKALIKVVSTSFFGSETDWKEIKEIFESPENSNFARFCIDFFGKGEVWFDEAFFGEFKGGEMRHIEKILENKEISERIGIKPPGIKGREEEKKPILTFDNLENWKILYSPNLEVKMYKTKEESLWREYSGKLTFRKIPDILSQGIIEIIPNKNLEINYDFDVIEMWVYSVGFGRTDNPEIGIKIQDSSGKVFYIKLVDTTDWGHWFLIHKFLKEKISLPAKIISIVVKNITNIKDYDLYFDSIYVYKRNLGKIKLLSEKQLPFPTRKDTILPDLISKNYKNNFYFEKDKYIFSYEGDDGKIVYTYKPESGNFSDISVSFNNQNFYPLYEGGPFFQFGEQILSSDNPSINKKFIGVEKIENGFKFKWLFNFKNEYTEVNYAIKIKQKSLIINVNSSDEKITKLILGRTKNTPDPLLVKIPYITLYGSKNPNIVCFNRIFISAFFDWYNSNASALFGDTGIISSDSAKFNGGVVYNPKTDGRRNPLNEIIFLTISDKFEEVLPNIPNPKSPYKEITGKKLFLTRQNYKERPDYYDYEFKHWKKLKSYGVDEIILRLHVDVYRSSLSYHSWWESTFVTEAKPERGGDKALKEYLSKIKNELGWLVGLYTDYMIIYPTNPEFKEDIINFNSEGEWINQSFYTTYVVKPYFAPELQKKYSKILNEKFGTNASYTDQITALPPFSEYLVDYDERIPGAGKFATTFYKYGEVLLNEKIFHKGPVFSEGGSHWFYSGLSDGNYAQTQDPGQPVLVDFNLLKIKPLENNAGYDLVFSGKSGISPEQQYIVRAYTIAYGNIGVIYEVYRTPWEQVNIPDALKTYFLLQQLQTFYTNVDVETIMYHKDNKFYKTTEAIINKAHLNNQVYIKYKNGLEVYVNCNEKENWIIEKEGKKYILPPYGVFAYLPGKIIEYSALIDNHRVDFVDSPVYIYADGRGKLTDFGVLKTDGAVIIRKKSKNSFILTPITLKTDYLNINISKLFPGWKKVEIKGYTEEGREIKNIDYQISNDALVLKIYPEIFNYEILIF
ncbi:MAG: hypothetical protein NC915_05885 [Candidatus Omnitrophica bacterium]|nr:hypothetical protein [Candidatus Omnitrophota bacterium]